MSYTCYLGGMEVPTPAKLTVKIKGKNKTLVLLNEGEINFLRTPGLTEITVPLVLPMLTGGRSPSAYLDMLEGLKTGKKTTQFILVRSSPNGRKPKDYAMSEIKRRITEALMQDDRITSLSDWEFETGRKSVRASFVVHTIYGDVEATKEVDL